MSTNASGDGRPVGQTGGMRPLFAIMLVFGSLLALIGLGLVAGGVAAAWVNSHRDGDGYLTSPTHRFSVDSYALSSPPLDVMAERGAAAGPPFDLGSIRLRATSATAGSDIFIGIGPRAEVDRYLADVHHAELADVSLDPFNAQYRDVPGSAIPEEPGAQSWWAESASGPGVQEITWGLQPGLRSGSWTVVVMNADASPTVAVDLQAGVRSDLLWPVAIALLVGGGVVLLIGVGLLVVGAVGLGRGKPPRGPGSPAGTDAGAGAVGAGSGVPAPVDGTVTYPARLSGILDPAPSRWLWLVKWVLIIPHLVVLFFLWIAFAVCTVIAGFAILFTAHYPRALFDFNVGVLRWNWRVAFYAYSALGTDRYPPFTLERADYPADFGVEYPGRLSRGLVLVKWWLLAIPQLLIVAVLSGGSGLWWAGSERTDTWPRAGVSLLGLLVLIAAVILLFTGRYRREIFDLIMGINRWIYRVITYTALFRDEYPPFRLDQGPADPASRPPAQPPG